MTIQKLSQAAAFGSGSKLWILPQVEKSAWTRKIDWYLNFQISRAKGHTPYQPTKYLKKVLQENKLNYVNYIADKATKPLLVASRSHLPNEITLEIPYLGDTKPWITQAHQYWTKLSCPTLRIFLPPRVETDQFIQIWPEPQSSAGISLVSAVIPMNN